MCLALCVFIYDQIAQCSLLGDAHSHAVHVLIHNTFTEAEVAQLPLTVAPAAAEQSTLSQVRHYCSSIVYFCTYMLHLAVEKIREQ
jgi:hypothetical protein